MAYSRLPAASLASEARAAWVGFAFLLSLALFGGASRADALSQPAIRLLSVMTSAYCLLTLTRAQILRAKILLVLLGLFAALCILQLMPLPPTVWAQLPGHDKIAAVLRGVETSPVWRPLSLAPDRTLNALLASLPVFATLLVLSMQSRHSVEVLAPWALLVAMGLSGLAGLSQLYSGWPYPYRITNEANAVGLFANRNHSALFVATGFPMLAHLAVSASCTSSRKVIWVLCSAIGIVLLTLLITNGSRGGLVAGLVGMVGGAAIFWSASTRKLASREIGWGLAAALLMITIVSAVFLYYGRSVTFARIFDGGEAGQELRLLALPTVLGLVRDYVWLGAGLGAFEAVYKIAEPDALIGPLYLNHAHNDFLELAIDAGLPGLAVLALLVIALIANARSKLKVAGQRSITGMALVIVAQFAIASALDYPLRTPFMSALFCYAAFLIIRPVEDVAGKFAQPVAVPER